MNELKYEESFLLIYPLLGGPSVYSHLEEILIQIETEVGPITPKPILCQGEDVFGGSFCA